MKRLVLVVARAVLVIALLVSLAPAALAQTAAPAKTPVIDAAPARVGYDSDVRIKGHLDQGAPGDEVTLQRRKPDRDWTDVKTKPVDDEARVRFSLLSRRSTARYRLVYLDPATQVATYSDVVTIAVEPHLRMEIRPRHVLLGGATKVVGHLLPAVSGRRILVQQRVSGSWRTLGKPTVRDGRFSFSFEPGRPGGRRMRVRFKGDPSNLPAGRKRWLYVYRRAVATWYGPGFYGQTTACGQTLTRDTLGVAHKTLPCGTEVAILYRGETITVPVIDRGPYADADFDLTSRTARRLGFSGTGEIGVDTQS